ncbi:MAG: hypothetical protein COA94_04225 [Rickettsiales bacterium]|nr:MAG: hypothetical protein COA94_04225 [Rickettsiales bacterium]
MLNKKYFSIAEVTNLTGISQHKLRYIEKIDSNISVIKLRGRRYYTKKNIEHIQAQHSQHAARRDPLEDAGNMAARIDHLLQKFRDCYEAHAQLHAHAQTQT